MIAAIIPCCQKSASLIWRIISLLSRLGNFGPSGRNGVWKAGSTTEIPNFPVIFPVIRQLSEDPKILAIYDTEVVCDAIAEERPVFPDGVS